MTGLAGDGRGHAKHVKPERAISLLDEEILVHVDHKNLNLDVEALVSQVDEIKGHPELMAEAFASHPLLPIRLKALELFSRSGKARRNGLCGAGTVLSDGELEDAEVRRKTEQAKAP